jgi:hypothetical protein
MSWFRSKSNAKSNKKSGFYNSSISSINSLNSSNSSNLSSIPPSYSQVPTQRGYNGYDSEELKKMQINAKDTVILCALSVAYFIAFIYKSITTNETFVINVVNDNNVILTICFMYGFVCRIIYDKLCSRTATTIINNLYHAIGLCMITLILLPCMPFYFKFVVPILSYKIHSKIMTWWDNVNNKYR